MESLGEKFKIRGIKITTSGPHLARMVTHRDISVKDAKYVGEVLSEIR